MDIGSIILLIVKLIAIYVGASIAIGLIFVLLMFILVIYIIRKFFKN